MLVLTSCAGGDRKTDTADTTTPTDIPDTDTDTDADADADTDADTDSDTDADTDSDTALPWPDLVPTDITRDDNYYRVTFCNNGGPSAAETFVIRLSDVGSGETFDSNPLYPYPVPPPGFCETTGGFTCALIGDAGCNASIDVMATVDPYNTVAESNEANNEMTLPF